ncbi:methyltransferase [Acidihalobacter yilgarnensis]|uniref:Methyltransferase n=1 Tax=Acidihalobacter yilgarnensis TaxID=2819280 RepID=A0A1D8IPV7_9GAMM|nr:class I SAM-dependent methyltransferase [Acidihalobacter yilgarnensis]AOU98424.1 methyltransferase [Acidihalobacter yilgarnensis]
MTKQETGKPAVSAAPPIHNSEFWNQRYADKAFVWTANANRFVAEETAGLPPGKALDLAAGEGRNAVWLAEQGWQAHAVDFSDVAMEKCRRLAVERQVAERVTCEVADLHDYAPTPGAYDLVLLIYLQIPQDELAPVIARAAEAVAPGGTFLLVAHDSANLKDGYGGPQNPDVLYTAEQVLVALDDRLDIEKAGVVERPVETDNGIKVALDCLVRGKRPD